MPAFGLVLSLAAADPAPSLAAAACFSMIYAFND
jgi:hypothetical protein